MLLLSSAGGSRMLAQHPALVIILLPTWTLWFIVWLGLAASRCSGTGRHYFSKVEVLGEEKCIPVAVLLTGRPVHSCLAPGTFSCVWVRKPQKIQLESQKLFHNWRQRQLSVRTNWKSAGSGLAEGAWFCSGRLCWFRCAAHRKRLERPVAPQPSAPAPAHSHRLSSWERLLGLPVRKD